MIRVQGHDMSCPYTYNGMPCPYHGV